MPYTDADAVREDTPFKDDQLVLDEYIETKIDEADAIINAKIGDVYTLPLAVAGVALVSPPPLVSFLSKEITKALLFMSQFSEEVAGSTVDGKEILKFAMSILEDIQKRKTKLKTDAGVSLDTSTLLNPVGFPTTASDEDGTAPIQHSMIQKF